GFAQHVGYITPGHSAVVRGIGPSAVHRLSFQALCYSGGAIVSARESCSTDGRAGDPRVLMKASQAMPSR
ncbi:MAG: hypothetical protein ACRDNM_12410, partial [Gaiellaceae bacterium]